jgi:hypothetical protein
LVAFVSISSSVATSSSKSALTIEREISAPILVSLSRNLSCWSSNKGNYSWTSGNPLVLVNPSLIR